MLGRVLGSSVVLVAVLMPAPGTTAVIDPIPTPSGSTGVLRDKSLVIGIDGAGLAQIKQSRTPRMQRLMKNGTTSVSYRYGSAPESFTQQGSTVSGPGWATALSGVWPDKHGVRDNSFSGKRLDRWPDYLTRAERAKPRLSTFAVADWDPIATLSAGGPIISDEIDVRIGLRSDSDGYGYAVNDERSADVAARYLKQRGPDLSFVYFGEPDAAGHAGGSASPGYRASLEKVDRQIGQLLRAIRSRPTYSQERWLVIVTNDHGHTLAGGHGGNTLAEREQFVIASGPGIPRGVRRNDLNVTDVAATALAHAGVRVPAGLDGTPIQRARRDGFESVRGAVADRGWTRRTPKGWRIDNSRMPSGGDRPWRGWVFTGNPFWSQADTSQGRENFVRGRGVIAVADSDEWDDVDHGDGRFDSTLISPGFRVKGQSRALLTFQHFYQQEADQRGRLLVGFDGRRPRLVTVYAANSDRLQKFSLKVPKGATRMRALFRYTGDNNWYWAVDDVRVR